MVSSIKLAVFDMFRFPKLGIGTYRVWYRDFYYFKKYLLTSLMFGLSEPILYIVAFGYGLGAFVGEIDGVSYMQFLAPAIAASTAMMGSVFEATYSSFTKLSVQKTYETIMMTPVGVEDVVVGEIFFAATKSFFGVLCVVLVYVGFGVVTDPMAWLALPILFLVSLCFSALAMVVTSYARDYDFFTYFFSLFITPMSLLAGTYFPLSRFPQWAQVCAWGLPLTHGVNAVRFLFLGKWDNFIWINVGVLILASMLFTNWAVNNTRRRLIY